MQRIVLLLSSIAAALVLACGVGLLNAAKPAEATFPGQNGRIAYAENDDLSGDKYSGDNEIYTINPDGTGKLQLTNNDTEDFSPDYSPDAKKIVYVGTEPNGPGGLYIANADGSGEAQYIPNTNTVEPQGPSFSPDGTKIAFFSYKEDPWAAEIYTINTDGSGLFRVTNSDISEGWPDWSPKGNKIVYDGGPVNSDDTEIYTINTDGTGRTQVTSNITGDRWPEYSPSGNKIVYAGGYPKNDEIYTITTDGTGRVKVTNNNRGDTFPTYSPDGKRIAYTSHNQKGWSKLLKIPVGGGTPTPVESHDNSAWGPLVPSWGSQ